MFAGQAVDGERKLSGGCAQQGQVAIGETGSSVISTEHDHAHSLGPQLQRSGHSLPVGYPRRIRQPDAGLSRRELIVQARYQQRFAADRYPRCDPVESFQVVVVRGPPSRGRTKPRVSVAEVDATAGGGEDVRVMADGAAAEVLDAFPVGRDDGQLVEKVEIGESIWSARG